MSFVVPNLEKFNNRESFLSYSIYQLLTHVRYVEKNYEEAIYSQVSCLDALTVRSVRWRIGSLQRLSLPENLRIKLSEEELSAFYCNIMSYKDLIGKIKDLPTGWTVVIVSEQFSFSSRFNQSDNHGGYGLYVTRFETGNSVDTAVGKPFIIEVPKQMPAICKDGNIFTYLNNLLKMFVDGNKQYAFSRELYWKNQEYINLKLKQVANFLDEKWLKSVCCLFRGHPECASVCSKIQEAVNTFLKSSNFDLHFTDRQKQYFYFLAESSGVLTMEQIMHGVCYMFIVSDSEATDMIHFLATLPTVIPELKTTKQRPVVLIVEGKLDTMIWEMISSLCGNPVSRMPSFQLLYQLYKRQRLPMINKPLLQLEPVKFYYFLNPKKSGKPSLDKLESRLKDVFCQELDTWDGLIGKTPSSKYFKEVLQTADVTVYVGHGSGSQYLSSNSLARLNVKGVTFLFGCSSSILKLNNKSCRLSTALSYILAGCPCTVGALWDIPDSCAENILRVLLGSWIGLQSLTKNIDINVKMKKQLQHLKYIDSCELTKQEPELLRALNIGRGGAMQYIASAAFVARGLPVVLVNPNLST